ncbi:MAG: MIP family channel protein [Gemmatimonadota bacterium]|nr:MIP family channel protein [Gemmatimonadota bacterium]
MTTAHAVPRRALAEGIGTFFLVLIGPGAVMVNAYGEGVIGHAGVALAFGFVVLAMIYAIGHISGAHINPAVTLAFWSARRFPTRDLLPYVVAQLTGAILASLALRGILGPVGSIGATVPAIGVPGAFAVEWLLSFALMFVIMAVATDERVADGFAGVAVGLTVAFCAMMGGPLTGASMNPARSLGPAVAGGGWAAHWIYWLAPATAMVAAAWVYEYLRPAGMPDVVPAGVPLGVQGPLDADGASVSPLRCST